MTDEQYPFDYEPTQGTTFKDLYPGNDYSGMIAGRNASDALPAAQDLGSPQPSFWDKINTRAVATNPSSTPLVGALNGLANIFPSARPAVAANQAMWNAQNDQAQQQQAINLHKQVADRQAVQNGFDLVQKGMAISDPDLRKAYLTSLKPLLGQFTGEKNPALLDILLKTDTEQQPVLLQGMKDAFKTMGIDASPDMISSAMRDPRLRAELFAHIGAHQKLAQEKEQLDRVLQMGQALGGGAPTGDVSGLPSTAAPVQPQTQPGTSQGPLRTTPIGFHNTPDETSLHQQIDGITKALGASENVQNLTKVVARLETSNYDPHAQSKEGAQGLMQLMPATAQRHGVTNPFDRGQSITGGTKELMALEQKYGPDPATILAHYNSSPQGVAGPVSTWPPETQNYVARGLGLLGGRPSNQAALNAPPEYQQRLGQLNATIAQRQQLLNASIGMRANVHGKEIWEGADKALKGLKEERDNLQKQLEPKALDVSGQVMQANFGTANPSMLTPTQAALLPKLVSDEEARRKQADAQATEQSHIKVAAAQNENAGRLAPLSEPGTIWVDPATGKPAEVTTRGDLVDEQKVRKEAKQPPLQPWHTDDKLTEDLAKSQTVFTALDRVKEGLKDPEVQQLIGSVGTNPSGFLTRLRDKAAGNPNITPKQRQFMSDIAHTGTLYRQEIFGKRITEYQGGTLEDVLAEMKNASPDAIEAKLGILNNNLTNDYNNKLKGAKNNRTYLGEDFTPRTGWGLIPYQSVAAPGTPGASLTVDASKLTPAAAPATPALIPQAAPRRVPKPPYTLPPEDAAFIKPRLNLTPGSSQDITVPSGTTHHITVDRNGKWYVDVPKGYYDEPAATSATPVAPAPQQPQVSPAMQEALDILNGKK